MSVPAENRPEARKGNSTPAPSAPSHQQIIDEQNALGWMLNGDGRRWLELQSESFKVQKHRIVFEVVAELQAKGEPHTDLDVIASLRFAGRLADAGGDQLVTKLRFDTIIGEAKLADIEDRLRAAALVIPAPHARTLPTLTFSDTDIANGKRLAHQHGTDLRFTAERGWLVWDGRRWATDEKAVQVQERAKATAIAIFDEVKGSAEQNLIFKHAKRSQQKKAIEAMIWLARSEPGIPARIVDFDTDGYLFNVANGTVDLHTGELRPYRRQDLISNLVEVPFQLDAQCELWDAFLWRVTDKNEELYDYLQRFVGYLLIGDTTEQALHFLYGLGANGKTVFCDVLMRILGDYAVAVSPDLIMVRRHSGIPNDVARLRGARAALMNETTQGARFDEAKLKDLTGGDVLSARFLHAAFFDFRPTHRIVIRGNHKPTINGTDEGIWRRLRLVPFTVSIPKDEQDRNLLKKLDAQLPGILQWAIKGCLAWQRQGLAPPAIITEAVRAYREESDTLGRFINECCEVRKLSQVKSGAFFKRYQEFAERCGERWMPSNELPNDMQRRGFQWTHTNKGGMYFGLELIADFEPHWSDRG